MGEIIYTVTSSKRLLSKIHKTLVESNKKNTNPIKIWEKLYKNKLSQKQKLQMAKTKRHELMLCIINHQGDANLNKNNISSHNTETGTHDKEQKQPVLACMQEERDSHLQLVKMPTGSTFLENNIDIFPKLEIEVPFNSVMWFPKGPQI